MFNTGSADDFHLAVAAPIFGGMNNMRVIGKQSAPQFGPSLSEQASALHDEALARFKSRCFWNATPPKSEVGLAAVHERLQSYGDMEAWRLAAKIREVMRHAP
jgi:hypothetical protein